VDAFRLEHVANLNNLPMPLSSNRWANVGVQFFPELDRYVIAAEGKDYFFAIYIAKNLINGSWVRVPHCDIERFYTWKRALSDPADYINDHFMFGESDTAMSLYRARDGRVMLGARVSLVQHPRRDWNWGKRGVGFFPLEGFEDAVRAIPPGSNATKTEGCLRAPKAGWFHLDSCVYNCQLPRSCPERFEGMNLNAPDFFGCVERHANKSKEAMKFSMSMENPTKCFTPEVLTASKLVKRLPSGLSPNCHREISAMLGCAYFCRGQIYSGKITRVAEDLYVGAFPEFVAPKHEAYDGLRDDILLSLSSDGVLWDMDLLEAEGNPVKNITAHLSPSEMLDFGEESFLIYSGPNGLEGLFWTQHRIFALTNNATFDAVVQTRPFVVNRTLKVDAEGCADGVGPAYKPSLRVEILRMDEAVACEVRFSPARGEARVLVVDFLACAELSPGAMVFAKLTGKRVHLYSFIID